MTLQELRDEFDRLRKHWEESVKELSEISASIKSSGVTESEMAQKKERVKDLKMAQKVIFSRLNEVAEQIRKLNSEEKL